MSNISRISEGWKALMSAYGPTQFHDAKVLAVDADQYLCDVLFDGEVEKYDIRLRAVVSDKSSIDIMPKVGSQVVIGKLNDDDYIVIACDEITNYRVSVGKALFEMTAAGFLIQNDTENFKQILSDLIDCVLNVNAPKDVASLTLIKTRLNDLLK